MNKFKYLSKSYLVFWIVCVLGSIYPITYMSKYYFNFNSIVSYFEPKPISVLIIDKGKDLVGRGNTEYYMIIKSDDGNQFDITVNRYTYLTKNKGDRAMFNLSDRDLDKPYPIPELTTKLDIFLIIYSVLWFIISFIAVCNRTSFIKEKEISELRKVDRDSIVNLTESLSILLASLIILVTIYNILFPVLLFLVLLI